MERLLGNQKIKETLKSLAKNKSIPNSVIIEGEESSQRDMLCEILAELIMCEKGIACGACSNCQKLKRGNHPDFYLIDNADDIIKVDEIRELKTKSYILPNDAEKNIFIIKNAENMNIYAQNALLKLLEEPPRFSHFVLSTKNKNSLLETIGSRCITLRLSPLDDNTMLKALKVEFSELEEQKIKNAIALSNGSISKAKEIIENKDENELQATRFTETFLENKLCELFQYSFLFEKKSREQYELFLNNLNLFFTGALEKKVQKSKITTEISQKIAEKLTLKQIANCCLVIKDTCRQLEVNINTGISAAAFIVKIYECK